MSIGRKTIALRAAVTAVALGLGLGLGLSACSGGGSKSEQLNALDAELADGETAGNQRDPALTAALQDEIMVDPALVGRANLDAVRPPGAPYAAPVPPDKAVSANADGRAVSSSETIKPAPKAAGDCPQCAARRDALTLGGLAARQQSKATRGCAGGIGYSTRWAQNLPAAFPLYSDARVSEAAGHVGGGCALRIVSFASAAAPQTLIDFYHARAQAAGFAATHRADGDDHVVEGTRGDASVIAFISPRDDRGSDVDLVLSGIR